MNAVRPIAVKLDQDTRAVTQQRVRADCAAVVQIVEDFERLANDRMAFRTFNVSDKAHTTCVMLSTRIIKALRRRKTHR